MDPSKLFNHVSLSAAERIHWEDTIDLTLRCLPAKSRDAFVEWVMADVDRVMEFRANEPQRLRLLLKYRKENNIFE